VSEYKIRKKTDRRVIYTKSVIKDSLLEEMKSKPFADVGITHICKRADISRSTFYLHYGNLIDVLEEIIDDALKNGPPFYEHVMRVVGGDCERCAKEYDDNPICMTIQRDWKYRILFNDNTASAIVLDKIYKMYKDGYIKDLVERVGISEKNAEVIFHFQMNGCISAAMRMNCDSIEEWMVYRKTIDTMLGGGLKELMGSEKSKK